MQTGTATMEHSMELPPINKNGTASWPSDSTSGYISKESQNTNLKGYMHHYVNCNIIYNSQDTEAKQVPNNKQVDKKAMVHIYNGILLGHKKHNKILPFATAWRNLEVK